MYFIPTQTTIKDLAVSCDWPLAECCIKDTTIVGISIDSLALRDFQMAKTYLSRSGALPLDIRAMLRNNAKTVINISSIYQTLTAHLHRWSRLQLHCVWLDDLKRFLDLILPRFPVCSASIYH